MWQYRCEKAFILKYFRVKSHRVVLHEQTIENFVLHSAAEFLCERKTRDRRDNVAFLEPR